MKQAQITCFVVVGTTLSKNQFWSFCVRSPLMKWSGHKLHVLLLLGHWKTISDLWLVPCFAMFDFLNLSNYRIFSICFLALITMKQKSSKVAPFQKPYFFIFTYWCIFLCSFFKAIESFQTDSISTTAESSSTKESKSTEDINLTEEINPSALPLTAETPPAPQKLVTIMCRNDELSSTQKVNNTKISL